MNRPLRLQIVPLDKQGHESIAGTVTLLSESVLPAAVQQRRPRRMVSRWTGLNAFWQLFLGSGQLNPGIARAAGGIRTPMSMGVPLLRGLAD